MTVLQIIQAVVQRVGKSIISDYGENFIVETMARIYKETNEDLKCLQKEYTFTFDATAVTNGYMDLPADWLWPTRLSPYRIWRDPKVYLSSEPNTFTIAQRRLYIAGVAESDVFDTMYVSQGKTLVNKTDAEIIGPPDSSATEANTPEWTPDVYHPFLIYATALELKPNYPLQAQDLMKYQSLRQKLDRSYWLQQLAAEPKEGPGVRQDSYTTNLDPYAIVDNP